MAARARGDRNGSERAVLAATVPARRRGLPDEVADQLMELIGDGATEEVVLPAERQLCDDLAVSRNVLREALAALTQMGVVETRGKTRIGRTQRARALHLGRGATPPPERELLVDPIEVRRILEPEVAALAAERITDGALREMERALELMAEGIEAGHSVVEADSAFHVAIARATGNQILIELIGGLGESLRRSREMSFLPREAAQAALADHHEIVAAIRTGKAATARRAMLAHLGHVEALLRTGASGAA